MRVLVAHNFYKLPGGEDQCVTAETGLLRSRGHDVRQYCVSNDAVDSIGRGVLAAKTVWNMASFRAMRRAIADHRPDVVHFHNTLPLISPAAFYAARAEGVPVVQTLHNYRLLCVNALLLRNGRICEDCLGKVPWRGATRKCYRDSRAASTAIATMITVHRLLRTWRRAIDAYIAPSEFSRRKFIEGGLPEAKIYVKPNFAYPDPNEGDGAGGYAVYVGRLSGEKGIDTLLSAWRLLGGAVPLRVAGDGPLAPAVREACAQDPSIRWLENVPYERVCDLIGSAAVLIVPSRCYEGALPRVVIEAFAKGTPVVVSELGAMANAVDGQNGLCFRPGDPIDLAASVRRILENPAALRAMRRRARESFEADFGAEANHDALVAIYARAAAARGRGTSFGCAQTAPADT